MGPPPGSTVLPEQGTLPVAGPGKKPLAAANSAAVASTTSTLSAAPPTSVLTKRPTSMTGLVSTSPAKKPAFTSPYHKFCQELRPQLLPTLRNSEREKLLGVAWKALCGGWHEGTRVAWAHEPAPQLQLAAPPAPQLFTTTAPQLGAPPAPQLQLTMAQQLQFSAAVMLPPPPAPTAAPVLWAARVLPIGMPVGVPVPLQDLRLPPLLPCMPRHLSYPAASPPAPAAPSDRARVPELLAAAAAHRTFVQLDLGGGEHLAELIEEQMTGEDATDIAISLGMPH